MTISPGLRAAIVAALFVVLAVSLAFSSGAALADNLKRFDDYMDPIERTLDLIEAGDFDALDDFLADEVGFGEGARLGSTLRDKVLKGDAVVDIDLLREDELGTTLKRLYFAVRDTSDTYFFVRFHVVRTNDGWVMHHFHFNTDMTDYFPGWVDP